ncbi:MAG TPA: PAS domain-containing protein [Candidatus Goldiibacteriota bacterium]|nr:PAS domain-containing protein [Candidatus Goldiibacteriota bacterium]
MNLKELSVETIEAIMDAMPVDCSFVDANDTVKYFNTPKSGRIFPRTKMDLGRKVQNCHPPKSLDKVNAILNAFKSGSNGDSVFWIDFNGRKILIKYFPVRDKEGRYLGCLEVTQDITEIKRIEGEKRL